MTKKAKEIFTPDFIIIPFQLVSDKRLQPLDRDLYGVIYWFEHLKDGECKAANTTMAQILNATPRGVQNSLTSLESAGYIIREFKDASKRHRKRIKTLISYRRVRTDDDTGDLDSTNDDTVRTDDDTTVRTDDDQISNINISNKDKDSDANITGKRINDLVELFKPINPSWKRLFANKTQRAAIERLDKQWGEKLDNIIGFLEQSNRSTYAPTITTPVQLENRMGDLMAWSEKQKSKVNSGGKKILA